MVESGLSVKLCCSRERKRKWASWARQHLGRHRLVDVGVDGPPAQTP
jgi:hypothetical protein